MFGTLSVPIRHHSNNQLHSFNTIHHRKYSIASLKYNVRITFGYVTGLIVLLCYSTFNLVSHNQPFASETCVMPTNKIMFCSMTLILNSVITKKSILYDKNLLRNGTSKFTLYSITNYCQWEAGINKGQIKQLRNKSAEYDLPTAFYM